MQIRDPIHGNIRIGKLTGSIIDLPEMQRLRRVKQLGFDYLIYPGANHTRFEHSIGSMHVTNEIMQNIGMERDSELAIVALIHDIGHGPFSHQSEVVLEHFTHKSHEKFGEERIMRSKIKEYVDASDLSFKKVMSYFKGGDDCEIVGGALGSDRIDYIMRDAYYTGVAYGMVDYNRLKSKLALYKGRPAIYENGVSAAELMLIARYFMFQNVYGHHTARIAEGMFGRALFNAIENGDLDANEAALMVDDEVMQRLKKSKKSAEFVKRIDERNLYKRVYYRTVDAGVKMKEIENALGKAGLDEDDYVLSLRGFGSENGNITVLDKEGDKIGMLDDFSALMKTLDLIVRNKKKLLVACDKRNVARAKAAVEKVLQ